MHVWGHGRPKRAFLLQRFIVPWSDADCRLRTSSVDMLKTGQWHATTTQSDINVNQSLVNWHIAVYRAITAARQNNSTLWKLVSVD